MTEYILIGAEGKEEKKPDGNTSRSGQGLYYFPWSSPKLYAAKSKPDLELIISDDQGHRRRTPRALKSIDNEVYLLTTSHLKKLAMSDIVLRQSMAMDKVLFLEEEKLDTIFSLVSTEQRFKEIIGKNTTNACFEKTKEGLFMALFNYDNLKIETGMGGYLFRLDSKNGPAIEQIPNFDPTGALASTDSALLVACGSSLQQLLLSSNQIGGNSFDLQGNILAISHFQERILLSDNKEGYLLITQGNSSGTKYQKWPAFVYFRDNELREYLPSEATCVLLMPSKSSSDPNGKLYAFFGCDDGKILVYHLQQENMKYLKTINLLSEKARFEEAGKDNHIWNLRSSPADYIQFTLRNMYVRIGVQELVAPGPTMSINIDALDPMAADQLRPQYGIDRLCRVPHQISCMEIIKI